MRRVLIAIAAIVVVAAGAIVFVAMPDDDDGDTESASRFRAVSESRSYAVGSYRLELDGADAGAVKVASPGGPFADVIAGGPLGGEKHLGAVRQADIVLDVSALPTALTKWIADTIKGGGSSRRNGALTTTDAKGTPVSRTEFQNALLTEIQFPALDGASKEAANVRLTLSPESTKTVKGGGAPAKASAATKGAMLAANFRVSIPGLETNRVSKVDALTIKQTVVENAVEDGRFSSKGGGGPLNLGNLRIDFSEVSAPSWVAWFEDFALKGNSGPQSEKPVKIELLTPDLKGVTLTLDLSNCGIFKLGAATAASGDTIPKMTADLYCETIAPI